MLEPGVADVARMGEATQVGRAVIGMGDAAGGCVATGVACAAIVGVGLLYSCDASNMPANTVAIAMRPATIPPRN